MNGSDLFKTYAKRDFSGSPEDQYAQLLMTIWSNIREDIYPLLEQAERTGKKLSIKGAPDEIITEDVILT